MIDIFHIFKCFIEFIDKFERIYNKNKIQMMTTTKTNQNEFLLLLLLV